MRAVAPLVVLVCAMLAFASGLGAWALFEPDEGRNAEIAREMLASGDWVVPHLNGVPFLDKPPLLFWMVATGFRLLGESEWVARRLESLGHEVIVADPNFAPIYASRSRGTGSLAAKSCGKGMSRAAGCARTTYPLHDARREVSARKRQIRAHDS